ncbi:MAG: ComEA family DNA-binding protein [Nocardioides sp.]
MRPRGTAHADAVSRRLEQLSAELGAVRRDEPAVGDPFDLHTHIRPPPPPEEPAPVAEPPVIPVPGRHAARRSGWSPGGLLAGRVALGPGQLAALAVLVAVALACTAWWVLRDGSRVDSLAPVPGPAPASARPGVSAAPTGTAAAEVVVDVAGKVRRPGIVVLRPGARVVDALDAAGGARRGADLAGLNLARLLVDGEQIVVGVPPPPGPAASAAGSPGPVPGALVNLNTASLAELDELPGVGPVTAQAIVDWRTGNGGFRSVDQLLDVDGIGEKTLADLAPLVTV